MLTGVQSLLVGLFVQALLYGVYLETLVQCLRWLLFTEEGWKTRDKIYVQTLTFATIFISLTSTINIFSYLQCVLQYLKAEDNNQMTGSVMTMNVSGVLTLLAINYVLIYRCWVVYAKSWRIIYLPVIFWLASVACSALLSFSARMILKGQPRHKFISMQQKALVFRYVCDIIITVYTTSAIIHRIYYTTKLSGQTPKRLKYVMRIVAESGILYTTMCALSLVGALLSTQENVTWVESLISTVVDSTNLSIAGITFNLLLIRVYESRVREWDTLVDSKHVDGGISEIRFNSRSSISSEESFSDSDESDGEIDETSGLRKSTDGI